MDTAEITQLIGQIGAPMAVALIVLLRIEPAIKAASDAVSALSREVGELRATIHILRGVSSPPSE